MAEPYIGEIALFAGNFAPLGWALCHGQLLPIAEYTALFAIINTTYGGDGVTTFALPDLRGRVPIHAGPGPGLTNRSLGETGGVESVTLLQTQMPQHLHTLAAPAVASASSADPTARAVGQSSGLNYATSGGAEMAATAAASIDTAGGSQPHENRMPFLGVNFIIAFEGVYPSPA